MARTQSLLHEVIRPIEFPQSDIANARRLGTAASMASRTEELSVGFARSSFRMTPRSAVAFVAEPSSPIDHRHWLEHPAKQRVGTTLVRQTMLKRHEIFLGWRKHPYDT